MDFREDKNNIEKEFDPEIALMAQNAKMEMEEKEGNLNDDGTDVQEGEIMVEEEGMNDGDDKNVLRGKKKKKIIIIITQIITIINLIIIKIIILIKPMLKLL